jgi:hypothetical protein
VIRGLTRAALAVTCAGLIAGCGSPPARVTGPAPGPVTAPLSTSLVTAQGTWAVAVMGRPAQDGEGFWQLFVRPAGAGSWSLVTPEGVADNGGLVAAGGAGSVTVGFRPSQNLAFSPLATSTDTGRNWTPGLLDAGLASTPGAIAVGPSGRTLALLQDGTIEAATARGAAAGQWSPLVTAKALAASAAGRACGLTGVNTLSFGAYDNPMAGGGCARPGVAGVFTDDGGTWRSAGLALPGEGRVRVLGLAAVSVSGSISGAGGNTALLAVSGPGGTRLRAAWRDGTRWTVSPPLAAGPGTAGPVTINRVRALGFGPGGSAWLLLGGGRAESIGGPGRAWRALPPVPAGTGTLAPGPGGSYDALAAAGSRLTVWRLGAGTWARVQQISVPVQYGSSG